MTDKDIERDVVVGLCQACLLDPFPKYRGMVKHTCKRGESRREALEDKP